MGLCITCIGATLFAASRADRITPEIRGLAASSALALTGNDICYSARRRIGLVYLLDAVVEAGIAGLLSRRQVAR